MCEIPRAGWAFLSDRCSEGGLWSGTDPTGRTSVTPRLSDDCWRDGKLREGGMRER
jgi:hypothetical protein